MAEETTVSTPVDTTSSVDTSANVEPVDGEILNQVQNDTVAETSTADPTTGDVTAGTGTGERLYANKYKSVEELEKGYSEAQKMISKASEFEKKYNDLLEKQTKAEQEAQAQKLKEAQQKGFNDVESAEIANRVQLAEFEFYANGLENVAPEDYETVRQNLINYYNTGNKGYLNEAKRYFSSDFIENVASRKIALQNQLNGEHQARLKQQYEQNQEQLAQTLKTDYSEFLSDINDNSGKSDALKMFCNAGFIQSSDDMKAFLDVYGRIVEFEKAKAIKEYEAQKAIDATKQSAQISGNATPVFGDAIPTQEQLANMSQEQYEAAIAKYGFDKLFK